MEIKEIKRVFDLLLLVDGANLCKVSELAKELKVRKTELMQFILDNPKNFKTYEPKTISKPSDRGLRIKQVYLTAEDNPLTDEWLKRKKEECKKYIFINEWNNYGRIEGYFVTPDKGREAFWRNTEEKIIELCNAEILKPTTFYLGGFGDCSQHEQAYGVSEESLKKLKEMGWTFNELKGSN